MRAEDAVPLSRSGSTATRSIVVAASLGELGVGILATVFPGPVGSLLLASPVEGTGLVVVRMVGVSIAALGSSWWMARREAPQDLRRLVGGGFLVYNFGVALVFAAYALSQERLLWVPVLVVAVHLLVGVSYLLACARSRSVPRPT